MIYKVIFKNEKHLLNLERDVSIQDLNRQICKIFSKLPPKYILTYKDEDGDDVTLGNTNDLKILIDSGIKNPKLYIEEMSLAFFDQTQQFVLETVQQKSITQQVKISEVKVVKPEKNQPSHFQLNEQKPKTQEKKAQLLNEQRQNQQEAYEQQQRTQSQKYEEKQILGYQKNCESNDILVDKENLSSTKKTLEDKKSQKELQSQDLEKIPKKIQFSKEEGVVVQIGSQIQRQEQIQERCNIDQQNQEYHNRINETCEIEIQTQQIEQEKSSEQKKQVMPMKHSELSMQIILSQFEKMKANVTALNEKFEKSQTVSNSSQIKLNKPNAQQHVNIVCSLCNKKPIIGVRYQCTFCQDYNLCQICEDIEDHGHPFIKIKKPILCPKRIKAQLAAEKEQLRKKEAKASEKQAEIKKKELQIARLKKQAMQKRKNQQENNKKVVLTQKEKKQKFNYLSVIFDSQPKAKLKKLIEKYPHLNGEALIDHYLENSKQFENL